MLWFIFCLGFRAINFYHLCIEGGNVFSRLRLCISMSVCLSVNVITPEPLRDIIAIFWGHHPMVERETSLKVAV